MTRSRDSLRSCTRLGRRPVAQMVARRLRERGVRGRRTRPSALDDGECAGT